MFKTDITTENFEGQKVTKTLRFNLSQTEMLDLVKVDPTFTEEYLKWIVDQKDLPAMFDVIRKLIAISYGVMSEDGTTFRKKEEDVYDFLHSTFYDALIDKFLEEGNEQFMTDFIIGVFPAKFADSIRKGIASGKMEVVK